MNIINAARMEAIASYPSLVDWLRESHLESVDAMDDLMLTQPASKEGDDTLLVRAAWQRGETIGVKLITEFPGNTAGGDLPAIQAVYALFDGGDGRPSRAWTEPSSPTGRRRSTPPSGPGCSRARTARACSWSVRARRPPTSFARTAQSGLRSGGCPSGTAPPPRAGHWRISGRSRASTSRA